MSYGANARRNFQGRKKPGLRAARRHKDRLVREMRGGAPHTKRTTTPT